MNVNEKIRNLRIKRNLTQKQLAKLAGIAVITLQQYELGKRVPKTEQLVKIANAFEIPVDFFLTDWESKLKKENWNTSEEERLLMKMEHTLLITYRDLNMTGKAEAIKRIQELTELPRYTSPDGYTELSFQISKDGHMYFNKKEPFELNAAHARTDIIPTEAEQQHDDNIMDDENF